jgi:hypothetical protein
MKLFEVRYETDGQTIKAPGICETEVKRISEYYAAESIEAVWIAIANIHDDPEKRLIAIGEVWPLVTIIPASESALSENAPVASICKPPEYGRCQHDPDLPDSTVVYTKGEKYPNRCAVCLAMWFSS